MSKSVTQRIAKKQPDLLLFDGHDCVSALKALGEDNRVRIMGLLMDGPLGVCEIARRLGSTHYNVSKHLRILREAGLLEVEKHAASSSINERHTSLTEDAGVGGAASLQAASLTSPSARNMNDAAASPVDNICQSCTFNGVSSPRRNTLP